uniref:RDS/peripherin-like protein xRDS35 n=1 Tax=Caenorhabditis tropicalis TaxID=1561998 RepID=A0A1I7U466_9PELO
MISRRRRAIAGSDDDSKNVATFVDEVEPEPFEEMFSVFRIVTLYEMMIHGQWKYVNHYLNKQKTELVLGMYIGAAFELIRFVCVLILAIVFILMRISALLPLEDENIRGNINWIITMNGLSFWISLILLGVIIAQFAVYQCKNPNYVVYCTTINFMLSVILIASIIPLIILKTNSDDFMKEAFHTKFLRSGTMHMLIKHQSTFKCCGVLGPDDYKNEFIIQYSNALTNRSVKVQTNREFSFFGSENDNTFYSIPISCCKPNKSGRICSQRSLTDEEMEDAQNARGDKYWGHLLKYFIQPEKGTFYTKGCLDETVQSIDSYSSVLISILVLFIFFTALTIGFVIVLLLYHDGVGQMISEQKMFGVERNTGVHFLMSLDMTDTDFPDDFSLIEFLRKTDIDNFLAEDKIKGTIGGRKEAERA